LFLGRAEAAVQRIGQARALARASGHAFSLAYALHFSAVLHQLRRDAARTTEYATELLALARAQGFAPLQSWATLMLGCAAVEQGAVDEGIEHMRSALQAMRASPARTSRTGALAVLAAACLRQGDAARGLALVAEALALVATGGERFYEAELLRLRGELLLAGAPPPGSDPHAHAQADLARALAVARQQRAVVWALRAATALARLQAAAGQTAPARELLETALRDIADGAAWADVRDAQALLSALP
jgi:predicted ATPase